MLDFIDYSNYRREGDMGYFHGRDVGVLTDLGENAKTRKPSTRRLISVMSEDMREEIDKQIFIKQMLSEVYPKYHTEIEMLILSISNFTHREISEVLNISRLGVTKRIAKAREILKDKTLEMLDGETI